MINDVSRGALLKYQNLLLKWNKAINLISKNTESEIWQRHILDSLQLFKYMNYFDKVVDVGSGAGLPGIVLSIAGVSNVTMVESDTRKVVFLRRAAKISTGKIIIIEKRVDKIF